jgi:protein-L-isoaspartate(D-aspartate) O-methyltransferase
MTLPYRQLALCIFLACLLIFGSCQDEVNSQKVGSESGSQDKYKFMRYRMVSEQIEARGVDAKKVLDAMRRVPRHLFVLENLRAFAYNDHPLPIGFEQTISQPYIVALMTELMELKGGEKVLEIGTGSGYQAAVLAEIAASVYTIEIICPLAESAERVLSDLHYKNVHVRCADGYKGWPQEAPFDAIIVTAAPDHIPQPLVDQLRIGGRMVLPVGDKYQELVLGIKTEKGLETSDVIPVRFVPMTGEAQEKGK